MREEQRFENKLLRKMYGAKRDKITGEWRKLHNAELYAFYSSPNNYESKIEMTEVGRTCCAHVRIWICIQSFSVKT